MTLLGILKLIGGSDYFPPTMERKSGKPFDIDTRPQSVFQVTICFMCEEETWLTCNIQNEILIPWYDCEVVGISPSEERYSICVWLNDEEYLYKNFGHCFEYKEIEIPGSKKGEKNEGNSNSHRQ